MNFPRAPPSGPIGLLYQTSLGLSRGADWATNASQEARWRMVTTESPEAVERAFRHIQEVRSTWDREAALQIKLVSVNENMEKALDDVGSVDAELAAALVRSVFRLLMRSCNRSKRWFPVPPLCVNGYLCCWRLGGGDRGGADRVRSHLIFPRTLARRRVS